MSEAFLRGKNTTFRIYVNSQPFLVKMKSWSVEEQAVEGVDNVGGEQRGRPFIVTELFKFQAECFDDSQSKILANAIAMIAAADALQPDLPLAGGALFQYNDGLTKNAFTFNGAVRTPIKFGMSGRTETIQHTIGARFTVFNQTQAA